ncbi:MAG: hypothetical protein M3509_03885 [Chloroflexota bacterium]|nr:hypothetical protein [Chloroflexota bacterium]
MADLYLELRDNEDDVVSTPVARSEAETLELLETADFTASQLVPWGSNYTFAVALESAGGQSQLAIYKPCGGEAPLYDFPPGTLYRRERAAYLFSRELGWDFVPPTVVRSGPHGIGSVQLYVKPRPQTERDQQFWAGSSIEIERFVLFDHLTNNADRKIGHLLRDRSGKAWGIDHGLTFNEYPKLRTVLWQFVGEPVSDELMDDLRAIERNPCRMETALAPYLDPAEIEQALHRVRRFLAMGHYPPLNPRRNVPYGWW